MTIIDDKLSSLLIDNKFYQKLLDDYKLKLQTTKVFLDKERFIEDEIKRIESVFIKPMKVTIGPGWNITSGINFTTYAKYSYDWLMSGQDWSIAKIVKGAKSQVDQSKNKIEDEDFSKTIRYHLNIGAGYVLYNKFLNDEYIKINKRNARSVGTLVWKFFLNPWIITILGGLIIAFLAKKFGWI